jgi:hypothetical protein
MHSRVSLPSISPPDETLGVRQDACPLMYTSSVRTAKPMSGVLGCSSFCRAANAMLTAIVRAIVALQI